MEKNSCKLCGRSFGSGRSLGGHMRSHVVMSSSLNYEEKSASGYGLRENPRKSWRLDEAWSKMEKDKLCTKKHCSELEVEGKEREDSWSTGVEDVEGGEIEIQNEGEVPRKRRQRRRSKRVETISASSPLSPSSLEYGALCLMMLSRSASSVSDSSHVLMKRYESEFFKIGLKKVELFPSESGFPVGGEDDESKKGEHFTVLESEKRNKSSRNDFDSGTENCFKRGRYECTICSKSFHSYQALGGHCASHKKNRSDTSPVSPAAAGELFSGKFRAHQCPICGKVFASGQALGGHKRSHLISENNASSSASAALTEATEIQQKISEKKSLDLNLPAPDFGIPESSESDGISVEIKFTDFEESCRLQAFMIR